MFLVSDKLSGRRKIIRKHSGNEATLGALLAVIDFEWTVRRALIALSYPPTKVVRAAIEKNSGPVRYNASWNKLVYPLRKQRLSDLVPDWNALKNQSFQLRHKIVHGVEVKAKEQDAVDAREIALAASESVCIFAKSCSFDLYERMPVRYKAVAVTK